MLMIYVITELIYGFTIPVPFPALTIFQQLLLTNGKISSKSLFWNELTQHADIRWQQQIYPQHGMIIRGGITYKKTN